MPTDKQIITASTSVSGTVTVPMQSYEYALVHVKVATGGDFDIAVSTTPTGISGDSAVSVIPSGTDTTDISDIMLEIGPTGADSVTVAWSNLSNNSASAHTITAATGYVDGQNVNVNSTLTTDAGPRTGTLTRTVTGLNCAPGADINRITGAASSFHSDDTGKDLIVANSATGGNNATYTLTYVSGTACDVTPDFTAPDDQTTTPALTATISDTISDADLAPGGDMDRLHTASAQFNAGDVGRIATVTGSSNPANDIAYTITAFIGVQDVDVTPDFTATDAGGGTLVVTVTKALSTVALAPGTDYTKVTAGGNMFSTYDVGRSLVIAAGANAGTYTIDTFTSATEIDVVETFPAITTGTAGTVTGTITGIDTAPGGDVDRVHTATAQFAEVDEGATLSISGSTWELNGYMRLWSEGKK